jgi:hypothetical protein
MGFTYIFIFGITLLLVALTLFRFYNFFNLLKDKYADGDTGGFRYTFKTGLVSFTACVILFFVLFVSVMGMSTYLGNPNNFIKEQEIILFVSLLNLGWGLMFLNTIFTVAEFLAEFGVIVNKFDKAYSSNQND